MVRRCLFFLEGGRDTSEQRASTLASQHACEHTSSLDPTFLKDAPTFGDPNQPAVHSVGHPHRTFRVQTDPVGRGGHLSHHFANVG